MFSLDAAKSVIDNNHGSNNVKLLPIFMQSFTINKNKAKCIKCYAICKFDADHIIFHLLVCNGGMKIEKTIIPNYTFNCLLCNFVFKNFNSFKKHIFKCDHIENSFDTRATTSYSYSCTSCNTYMYGLKDSILEHRCKPKWKPKHLSKLSELMAYVYENFNIHHKNTVFYCVDCSHFTFNVNDLHIKENCKAATDDSCRFECNSCMITFYDSKRLSYFNHKVFTEHIILWCLNGERTTRLSTSEFPKLPVYISKYFIYCSVLHKCYCTICDEIIKFAYTVIYDHHIKCISSKKISDFNNNIPLKKINCNLCDFQNSAMEEKYMYQCWIDHVISFIHLSMIAQSKEKFKLYSYYCYTSKTIFYGSEDYIIKELSKNNAVGCLLYVPEIMVAAYNQMNSYFSSSFLFCCGLCKDYPTNMYCKHSNIDFEKTFYCTSCEIVFNVQSDHSEHLVSSEHIILKYFKPIGEKESVFFNHLTKSRFNLNDKNDINSSTECIFMPLTNSDYEDNSEQYDSNTFVSQNLTSGSCSSSLESLEIVGKQSCASKKDTECINNANKLLSHSSSTFESKENLTHCNTKKIASSFIDALLAQPKKSSLNNYLRKNFELLNDMPEVVNIFANSKVFFCAICDLVLCDDKDWTEHYTVFHNEINDFFVFYCTICQIYHISTSNDINDHTHKTIEHNVMVKFKAYIKQNKDINKPIIYNNDSTEQVEQNQKTNRNNENYIEIKDVMYNLKKNRYELLKKLLKTKYGQFKEIISQTTSFIVLFKDMEKVKDLLDDSESLKKQYGFKIKCITHKEGNLLSSETKQLFSNWNTLCRVINIELISIQLASNSNIKAQENINKLCDSLSVLKNALGLTSSLDVHVFGSRIYGLASVNSDVDLYIDIGHTFNGGMADDIDQQIYLVNLFAEQFLLKPNEFKDVEEVSDARVPIVKFYHVPTEFNCDVSFKSGLGVCNSKLINLYLSMNDTVKWIVYVVAKKWALQNNLKDRKLFTSYALVWLVLFYLMVENVVPSLMEISKHTSLDTQEYIEGWNCTIGKWNSGIKLNNRYELLLGFFKFYTQKRMLKEYVLCTSTGSFMKKFNFFETFNNLSKVKNTKFRTFSSRVISNFNKFNGLVLQDPFELTFNITKNITSHNLTNFCEMCDQTVTVLLETKR